MSTPHEFAPDHCDLCRARDAQETERRIRALAARVAGVAPEPGQVSGAMVIPADFASRLKRELAPWRLPIGQMLISLPRPR